MKGYVCMAWLASAFSSPFWLALDFSFTVCAWRVHGQGGRASFTVAHGVQDVLLGGYTTW